MLPQPASASPVPRRVGVGIDTSRYGHYAAFLRDDLQPAAAELSFTESAVGYARLRQRLAQLAQDAGPVHFVVRVDAAGQYADNLLHFLHQIGAVTAAVLTAFIVTFDRFRTPGQLVKYFGVLPIEVSSGVDRTGQPRGPKRYVMSPRGNDLVRRYLWLAALSASRFNPAVRALYARVVAKHPDRKAVAVGHAMRKLLHLVFALGKTGRPFDPEHYPWAAAGGDNIMSVSKEASDNAVSTKEQAAGLKPDVPPARTEVTAACADNVTADTTPRQVDFAHVKQQLPLARVLDQLGLLPRLRGSGAQRRGPCPLHRGDGRGRTFSVNLDAHVFHCFDASCGKKGDVLDLWAALHGQSLREAALDLVATFHLEATPGTEKRHG